MTVYVDNARLRFGKMVVCRLVATSDRELHFAARRLGLRKDSFRNPKEDKFPHYDLNSQRTKWAILNGAIRIEKTETLQIARKCIILGDDKYD